MPLAAGAHLGPYEILSAIGAGGMGEVYRARDTRLERGDPNLPYLNCYPIVDPLRGDPRLQSLLRRIGLPQ